MTKGPKDQGTKNPRTKGQKDKKSKGQKDQRTKGPRDQRTKGSKDQRTKGLIRNLNIVPVNSFFMYRNVLVFFLTISLAWDCSYNPTTAILAFPKVLHKVAKGKP